LISEAFQNVVYIRRPVSVQPRLLLIVGHICGGKTSVSRFLEQSMGYTYVPCSRVLLNLMDISNYNESQRKVIQDAGYDFVHKRNGQQEYAKALVEFIQDIPHHKTGFVLDGLRYQETAYRVGEMLGEIPYIVYIENTFLSLYFRYQQRIETKISFRDFMSINSHPVEDVARRYIDNADFIIQNIDSLEQLFERVKRVING